MPPPVGPPAGARMGRRPRERQAQAPRDRVATAIADRARLSKREREILMRAVGGGGTRNDLMAAFGVTANTARSEVRGLLQKTGFNKLVDLVRAIIDEADGVTRE